jgi:hypothetical protein
MSYLRRRRDITPAQFYDYWENVHAPIIIPWAEKHGIRRYQQVQCLRFSTALHVLILCQVHLNGKIVPVADPASAPNAASGGELPTEPLEFDGIVMFVVPSLDKFQEAFKDPYYVEVIGPDECKLLDKDGPCSGVVASFSGKMIDKINGGKSCIGDKDKNDRKKFADFESIHGSLSEVADN